MMAVAAAVVTVIGAGCVSSWLMSTRIDDRATARGFRSASPGEPVAFERSALYDETVDGEQIYVYWWRVIDTMARIPGIDDAPQVGSWFVSPGLADRMADEPDLAERYPNAQPIGIAGIAHPGELLAYRFVDPDIVLSEQLSRQPGEDWIGDGAEVVDLFPIVVAALALIGIPGLGLLVAAMAPFASQLERRLLLLSALGASPGTRRRIVCLHIAVCAGPGAVVAAMGWFLLAPNLTTVPFVGRAVFASDLGLPLTAAGGTAVGVIVLAMAVAVLRPGRVAGNRPVENIPRQPTLARALPLLVGLSVMLAGAIVPGRSGAKVFLVGVIASTLGAVVGLPFLIDRVGSRLASRPETIALLVGRRLRWNAVASTRSLLAVGALASLIPLVAAWVAVARDVDSTPDTDSYIVELRGEPAAGDMAQLVRQTGALTLEVAAQTEPDGRATFELVGDCDALAAHLAFVDCGPDGFTLAADSGLRMGGLELLPGFPTRSPGFELQSTLFVSDDGAAIEQVLREYVVNAAQTGMQIATPGRAVFHESPLVSWILGAAATAGIVGAAALALHLAGQAARLAVSRARLLALGADLAVVRRLAGGEAALAVALVGLGCTAVGSISCWMFVQIDGTAAVPYRVIVLVVAAVAAAAGVAGLAAGLSVPEQASSSRTFSY